MINYCLITCSSSGQLACNKSSRLQKATLCIELVATTAIAVIATLAFLHILPLPGYSLPVAVSGWAIFAGSMLATGLICLKKRTTTPLQKPTVSVSEADETAHTTQKGPGVGVSEAAQTAVHSTQKGPTLLTHEEFMHARDPRQFTWELESYCPNPASVREETIQLQPPSTSSSQDKRVTIRLDAQPKDQENIPAYLTRVFNEYHCEPGVPRGFVFAGCDFLAPPKGKHPALVFLENHIEDLKKIGIKKIYVEQATGFREADDPTTQSDPYSRYKYFHEETTEVPLSTATISQIDQLAKKHGMEVIGAEVSTTTIHTGGDSAEARLRNFNLHAASLIRRINEPFVLFVGAAHGKLRRLCIPGASDYLDCPCIGLESSNLKTQVGPGTHQFTSRHYSVDAVFS